MNAKEARASAEANRRRNAITEMEVVRDLILNAVREGRFEVELPFGIRYIENASILQEEGYTYDKNTLNW